MSNLPSPEHVRPPQNLSDAALRQALDELEGKIRTLHNRAHATVAGSPHTYHEHAAMLEAKRNKLLQRLGPNPNAATATDPRAAATNDANHSTWDEIWRGIENLRNDLRNII